jgi:hypothetical protein
MILGAVALGAAILAAWAISLCLVSRRADELALKWHRK